MVSSIIFFGKPQNGFEAYEIAPDGIKQGDYATPELKSDNIKIKILHSFYKAGNFHLELSSCTSDRSGATIGVGVKSEKPIEISNENIANLHWLLKEFSELALDNDLKFKDVNLIRIVNAFYNSYEIGGLLKEFNSGTTAKMPSNNALTLLYLPNFENQADNVKSKLSDYGNIYISSDETVFEELINKPVFSMLKNVYYIVNQDGKIEKHKTETPKQQGGVSFWGGGGWKKPDDKDIKIDELEYENYSLKGKLERKEQRIKLIKKCIIGFVGLCIVAAGIFFLIKPDPVPDPVPNPDDPTLPKEPETPCMVDVGRKDKPNEITVDSCLKNLEKYDLKQGRYLAVITYCDKVLGLDCIDSTLYNKANDLKTKAKQLNDGVVN